jgi:hypothetical protein
MWDATLKVPSGMRADLDDHGRSTSSDAESGMLPKASGLEQTTELAVVNIVSVVGVS